jgi:hypothetical protein
MQFAFSRIGHAWKQSRRIDEMWCLQPSRRKVLGIELRENPDDKYLILGDREFSAPADK